MRTAIGVDLGGSHVTAAVVTEDGAIHSQHEEDLEDLRFEAVIGALDDDDRRGAARMSRSVGGIGIGSPGQHRRADPAPCSTARTSAGRTRRWVRRCARSSACPSSSPTTRAARRSASTSFGIRKGYEGLRAADARNGNRRRHRRGRRAAARQHWGAGEIGHHQIRPTDGFVCGCGKIGCFEAQASGTGLIRHAFAVAPSFPRSALLDVARDKLSSKKIRKAAQAGDGHALAAWQNFIADLAIGLANIIAFVNPETIALGGGVSSAGDFMLDAVRGPVDALTTMVPKGTTEIVVAALGNDAGQVGAATMAFRGGLTTGDAFAV